jgi:hypothetical protein
MSPPAKRQRTEDAPITRSDIWFTDGSVVLQAQNTQFRVHWGVLTQNSSFFRDMQALPQGNVEQPTVEGCPLVELHDDVEDVKHLLTTLYNPFVRLDSLKRCALRVTIQDASGSVQKESRICCRCGSYSSWAQVRLSESAGCGDRACDACKPNNSG